MALVGVKVTVGTAATLLAAGSGGRVDDPIPVVIKNTTTNNQTVFVGGALVTATGASTGYALEVGQGLSFQLINGETVYGIVASSTCSIDVVLGRQQGQN